MNTHKLTLEGVLEVFQKEGCYLSVQEDCHPDKTCNETPEIIRKSILSESNNDVENTLKAFEEFKAQQKVRQWAGAIVSLV